MKRLHHALFLAMALAIPWATAGVAAEAPRGTPMQLQARDQQRIAALACAPIGAAGIDKVEAWRQGTGDILVQVRCQPHATDYLVPVARQVSCSGSAGRWQCQPGADVLRMSMPDGELLSVTAIGLPLRTAAEAVREAAKLTIRPFYRPAVKVMREACSVAGTSTSTMRGAESFAIRCGATSMVLTRDCWDGGCRYFIPFAENY